MWTNLTHGKPNQGKNLTVPKSTNKNQNSKVVVHLPGKSSVVEWMEEPSWEQREQIKFGQLGTRESVQMTNIGANDEFKIRINNKITCPPYI